MNELLFKFIDVKNDSPLGYRLDVFIYLCDGKLELEVKDKGIDEWFETQHNTIEEVKKQLFEEHGLDLVYSYNLNTCGTTLTID